MFKLLHYNKRVIVPFRYTIFPLMHWKCVIFHSCIVNYINYSYYTALCLQVSRSRICFTSSQTVKRFKLHLFCLTGAKQATFFFLFSVTGKLFESFSGFPGHVGTLHTKQAAYHQMLSYVFIGGLCTTKRTSANNKLYLWRSILLCL